MNGVPEDEVESWDRLRKTDCTSFHLAKNITELKMKTINNGSTMQINENKPFSVDFVESFDMGDL